MLPGRVARRERLADEVVARARCFTINERLVSGDINCFISKKRDVGCPSFTRAGSARGVSMDAPLSLIHI